MSTTIPVSILAHKPPDWFKEDENIRELRPREFLESLEASIRERGLLQPVVALDTGWLVCGFQRLFCLRKIGVGLIPVSIFPGSTPPVDILAMQYVENDSRSDMTDPEQLPCSPSPCSPGGRVPGSSAARTCANSAASRRSRG